MPSYRINVRKGRKIPDWCLNWFDDPIFEGGNMSVDNMLKCDTLMTQFSEDYASKI